jgi:hypothetical protein
VDRNRNRDLSDDIRVGAKLVQGQGTLPPQEFKITMGGKEIDHKAKLMIYLYGDVSYQYLNTDYYMMGRITLDGKEFDAALIDGNGNGTFNDVEPYTDLLCVSNDLKNTAGYFWFESVAVMVLEDTWYLFEPEKDGSVIHYKGTADRFATLKTGHEDFSLKIHSPEYGFFQLLSDEGAIRIPPGEYLWRNYHIKKKDEAGQAWLFLNNSVMEQPLVISEGENHLELCFPLKQTITSQVNGDVVTFAQKVTGRNGEDVEIRDSLRSTQFLTIWQPKFFVEDGKGRVLVKGVFEAG